MNAAEAEFSRPVALSRLGVEPFCQEIEAAEGERERLARRLGLETLDRLRATVTLRRGAGETVLLDARFEAAFSQTCVVTLEPVPGTVSGSFALLYGPADAGPAEFDADLDAGADPNAPVFEPLSGAAIDIGEAVAQELSLALPEFPRHPDAAAEPDDAASEPVDGAFAALAGLDKAARE